jgi:hypothetical protein
MEIIGTYWKKLLNNERKYQHALSPPLLNIDFH